jgi:hypothetical protein
LLVQIVAVTNAELDGDFTAYSVAIAQGDAVIVTENDSNLQQFTAISLYTSLRQSMTADGSVE